MLLRIHRRPDAEQAAYDLLGQSAFGLKRAPQPSTPGLFRLRARLAAQLQGMSNDDFRHLVLAAEPRDILQ